jgi:predicted transcriptional regulator
MAEKTYDADNLSEEDIKAVCAKLVRNGLLIEVADGYEITELGDAAFEARHLKQNGGLHG